MKQENSDWSQSRSAVLRFAPSPNGRLHLGHAYSALVNQRIAKALGAKLFLRIEDTDLIRCTPVLEQRMLEDLDWLGFEWDGEPYRQSDHLEVYKDAIDQLRQADLIYPAFMSRKEVKSLIEAQTDKGLTWPSDPDGAPFYPEDDRLMDDAVRQQYLNHARPHSLRLKMAEAVKLISGPLNWHECGEGPEGETETIMADPTIWGDIVLSGKDSPASYHLASVVDDALMGVTHVVRGRDLFWSTAAHRLLQEIFKYCVPEYLHHDLILDGDERKLSKSRDDTSLAELRAAGNTPGDIRRMIGLED